MHSKKAQPGTFAPFDLQPGLDQGKGKDALNAMVYNPLMSAHVVLTDPSLSMSQRAIAVDIISQANRRTPSFGFTTGDLIHGAIGAGLGYGAAALTGKILGSVFSLSPQAQSRLSAAGAVGGLLKATGIWK